MLRKILKGLIILLGLILLVLLGLYLIPPKQQQIQYNYTDLEQNEFINNNVGYYSADNNKHYQVTWGAKQGLQLNYFDNDRNNLKNLRLTHIKGNTFDTDGNLETVEVTFNSRPEDSIHLLDVKTSKTVFTAVKNDSTFYDQQEVEYYNGDVRLSGFLMSPRGQNKATAIVFIHGSGVSDRDNFWYMHQADYLARHGYTVLLPDKRGCGKSLGEWHTASFQDFADDIKAALVYLASSAPAEFNKTGIIGISQGGWISHLVRQDNPDLDFVVDVVGSSTTPNEQVNFEVMHDIKNSGAPKFIAKLISPVFAKRARGKRKIWWDKNGTYDPISNMSKAQIPVLKIFGDQDENLPVARSLERLDKLIANEPNLPLEIKVFKDSGHGLMDKDTQWIRQDYLEYLNAWISKTE